MRILNDGVERACGLVSDEKAGMSCERTSDCDALLLPAQELVRIAGGDDFRVGETNARKQLCDLGVGLCVPRRTRRISASCAPMRMTGSRLPAGS